MEWWSHIVSLHIVLLKQTAKGLRTGQLQDSTVYIYYMSCSIKLQKCPATCLFFWTTQKINQINPCEFPTFNFMTCVGRSLVNEHRSRPPEFNRTYHYSSAVLTIALRTNCAMRLIWCLCGWRSRVSNMLDSGQILSIESNSSWLELTQIFGSKTDSFTNKWVRKNDSRVRIMTWFVLESLWRRNPPLEDVFPVFQMTSDAAIYRLHPVPCPASLLNGR